MPNLDGRGPIRGAGRNQKFGRNQNLGQGFGGSAECTCPQCGHKEPHTRGIPCTTAKCPKCNTPMRGSFCQ